MPAPVELPARFPFRVPDGLPIAAGDAALSPLLPVLLEAIPGTNAQTQRAHGLLDTGASVNVLPYSLGLALGAAWPGPEAPGLRLGGNLAGQRAHPLVLTAQVGSFTPVRLAFAWTRAEDVPLILGQINFFSEFDVCFYRSRLYFEVRPKKV